MARHLKFPTPADCKPVDPAVLCPAERVLGLYTQGSGKAAQRISKSVRKWFSAEAKSKGWAGVHFLPDVQSSHGAGCVLWRPPSTVNVTIQITNQLVLAHQTGEEG
jgi:hypothetical protein